MESNVLCSAEFSTVESIVEYIALYSFVLYSGKYGIVPGAWALHGDSTVLYSTVESTVQYSTVSVSEYNTICRVLYSTAQYI